MLPRDQQAVCTGLRVALDDHADHLGGGQSRNAELAEQPPLTLSQIVR